MRVKLFIFLLLQVFIVATWAKPHPMEADIPALAKTDISSDTTTIATESEWESYEDSEEEEGEVSILSVVFIQFF